MYNIFQIDGGIGKNIMGSAVLRNIAKSHIDNKNVVVCSYPEVFLHNPNVYRLFKTGVTPYFYDDYIKNKNSNIFKFDPYNSPEHVNKSAHLIKAWCNTFKINTDYTIPELYFNKIEDRDLSVLIQRFSPYKPYIIVQINGGFGVGENKVPLHWYRDVPPYYYQQIVNKFLDKFNFVLLKAPHQIDIQNTIVPNLTLRETFNLMRGAAGAICMDSMVQHAMAALGKPSLVSWIGNSPDVFGYSIHKNIKSNFEFKEENFEGYIEPYSIQSEGYQCPSNYTPESLFSMDELFTAFEELFVSKESSNCCRS